MLVLENNLLVAIVNRGHAERFFAIARKKGARGGTIIPAKGTATNSILAALGLGDTSKEIVLILLDEELAQNIMNSVKKEDKIQGVVALLGQEENNMDNKWKMIPLLSIQDMQMTSWMQLERLVQLVEQSLTQEELELLKMLTSLV